MIQLQQTRTDMRKSIITIVTIVFALLITNKTEAQQDPNFTVYNFNMNIINHKVSLIDYSIGKFNFL